MIGLGLGGAIRRERYQASVRRVFELVQLGGEADAHDIFIAIKDEAAQAAGLGSIADDLLAAEARAWQRSHASCPWCAEATFGARPA